MKGILERYADRDQAVILIEEIKIEVIVPISDLPEGSDINTWFHMEENNGEFIILSIDNETTHTQGNKTSELMKKLQSRKKESKFKRK